MARGLVWAALGAIPALLPALPAAGWSSAGGRVELHGFAESTLRTLSDGFDHHRGYLGQWTNVLDLEAEWAVAPDGWGPFDLVDAFARIEVRYECVYTGCGVFDSHRHFGDRARRAPARNWVDGVTTGYTGVVQQEPREFLHGGGIRLLGILTSPLLDPLRDLGATNLEASFAPVAGYDFAWRKFDGSLAHGSFQQGPWRPEDDVSSIGALQQVANRTKALPLRPPIAGAPRDPAGARGLFAPTPALRHRLDRFGARDLDFSQRELEWNHGAGQDEHELKELFVDVEAFDGRLWIRAGRQNIVWGKTELFRTTDTLNPTDIGLGSLTSLEESRIPLWSLRAVYSLYDVGPLQDVRLELAVNYDEVEPTDLGRCGEPYTVWLVCAKSFGAFGHGLTGLGLAGEIRPPDPWDGLRGLEVGARLEFRWERFSFALTDFYGYDDNPFVDGFYLYERNADPGSGRPRLAGATGPCATGREPACLTPATALDFHPADRQLFDLACSVTFGIDLGDDPGDLGPLADVLASSCILDVVNDPTPVTRVPFELSLANAVSFVLAGNPLFGPAVLQQLTGVVPVPNPLVFLNLDVGDVPDSPTTLNGVLTPEQQALLGCGPYYASDCHQQGIDLFNAEASVLVQAAPQVEPDPPVATRFVGGRLVILPGARGPGQPGYRPEVDGCARPDPRFPECAAARDLVHPLTGEAFRSELAALSSNFISFLVAIELAGEDPGECDFDRVLACDLVGGLVGVTGVQRPELVAAGNGRFGRRDFIWAGGGQAALRYDKRNVLGFALDFAEDRAKTSWSIEFTWIDDAVFGSHRTRSQHQRADVYNLTLSVDRPTFVNFLNPNRTFFFNSQWFFRYIAGYDSSFTTQGASSVLATFTVFTGYFQDRLQPGVTWVHDFGSASGGLITQIGYRFTEVFSVGFGLMLFYGGPAREPIPLHPLGLTNQGGSFSARTRYEGLSPIRERDELFLTVRYTF